MKAITLILVTAGSAAVAANCSPFNPELGNAPYKCALSEPRCPDGYTCMEGDPIDPNTHVCVSEGGLAPDAGSSGFQCLDDSGFGMNDTISGAFQTPVAGTMMSMSVASSICPETDKDHYSVNVTVAGSNLEVITSWESGNPVNVSILNASGTSIGNGTPMGDKAFRKCIPNLPIATYYVSAFAASTVKNNYRLSIKIVDAAACTP